MIVEVVVVVVVVAVMVSIVVVVAVVVGSGTSSPPPSPLPSPASLMCCLVNLPKAGLPAGTISTCHLTSRHIVRLGFMQLSDYIFVFSCCQFTTNFVKIYYKLYSLIMI